MLHCLRRLPVISHNIRPLQSSVHKLSTYQAMSSLPVIPTKKISSAGLTLHEKLNLTCSKIEASLEENQEDAFKAIRSVASANQDLLPLIREGDLAKATTVIEENGRVLAQLLSVVGNDGNKRENKLAFHLERFGTAHMLVDFFATGKLTAPKDTPLCNDEEYIAAAIGWAQELSRYALHRAIDGETASVELVRCALTELHQILLTFDFRNGALRRRYDGMKYFVKSVEDIAYELSLLPGEASMLLFQDGVPGADNGHATPAATAAAAAATTDGGAVEPAATVWKYIDGEAIQAIQQRMAAFDQQREFVIKEARDIQKLSKQAVFSVIRGQNDAARQKLSASLKIIERLFVIVNAHPTLRPGSFSGALEEWCEAQMLLDWCEKKTIPDISDLPCALNAAEYIGGLSDFTGELGRLAVMLAAKRELVAVREIMEVDLLIFDTIARVNNQGNNFHKKLEAVQTNLKKIESLVFELTIMERSGRMKKRMRLGDDGSSAAGPGAGAASDE